MKNPLDAKIVADGLSRAAMSGWPPITDWCNFEHLFFAAQTFKTVVDHLPDTVNLFVDLALTIL